MSGGRQARADEWAAPLRDARSIQATPRWPALLERLEGLDSVLVAHSGGVDSTLLTKVAHDVLGERALAVTAVSPSLAASERADAAQLAGRIGIRWQEVATREAEDPRYVANDRDRCYHCKRHLFLELEALRREAGRQGAQLAYGANLDDLGDDRPGMRAAREAGVLAPLLEAGLGKAEIREASRRLGLPTWRKPAIACLASRIPHGTAVSPERLARVERAEARVRALGFEQVRVRHLGGTGRVEVEPAEVPRALALADRIEASVREAGFSQVAIDPEGYRPGRLAREHASHPAPSSASPGKQERHP